MKVLIASDIHGSSFYTNSLIDVFNTTNADLMILLGDIYNHGPRNPLPKEYAPMKVADALNSIKEKILVIKGNCDSEVDQMISKFSFVDFAQVFVNNKKLTLTHGHIFNDKNMPVNSGDILAYGHFHVGMIENVNGVIVVNPGSISLPKDGVHSYILMDEKTLDIIDIETNKITKSYIFS